MNHHHPQAWNLELLQPNGYWSGVSFIGISDFSEESIRAYARAHAFAFPPEGEVPYWLSSLPGWKAPQRERVWRFVPPRQS